MNNVNDQLLLELNKMEKVQLSGQINGKPASTSTLEKIANFSKTSASKIDPLQQKQDKPTPSVRNLGERVAKRDEDWIKTKSNIQSRRKINNNTEDFRDNPIAGFGLNNVVQYMVPGMPAVVNAAISGVVKRGNNQYYKTDDKTGTSDYDKDRLKLQDIRRRQRSGELPMVDHKTRMAFKHAPDAALDDFGKTVKKAYTPLERRRNQADFTRHSTISGLVKQAVSDISDSTKDFRQHTGENVGSFVHKIRKHGTSIFDKLAGNGTTIGSAIEQGKETAHKFGDITTKAGSNLSSNLRRGFRHIKIGVGRKVPVHFRQILGKMSGKVSDTADQVTDTVKNAAHKTVEGVKRFGHGVDKSAAEIMNTDNNINFLAAAALGGESTPKLKHALKIIKRDFSRHPDESKGQHAWRLAKYAGSKLPYVGGIAWPFVKHFIM